MLPNASEIRINIVQGEYHVSAEPTAVITTLLGSCVAACMYDPLARVGGMNHYLLPGEANDNREAERYSVHLMELLVNGMLKCGASRDRLQAKLFGGAKTIQRLRDIGAANARFAREFLMREGINVVGASLGGVAGRRIQFWPTTGRARQMLMETGEHVPQMSAVKQDISPQSGELELF